MYFSGGNFATTNKRFTFQLKTFGCFWLDSVYANWAHSRGNSDAQLLQQESKQTLKSPELHQSMILLKNLENRKNVAFQMI